MSLATYLWKILPFYHQPGKGTTGSWGSVIRSLRHAEVPGLSPSSRVPDTGEGSRNIWVTGLPPFLVLPVPRAPSHRFVFVGSQGSSCRVGNTRQIWVEGLKEQTSRRLQPRGRDPREVAHFVRTSFLFWNMK